VKEPAALSAAAEQSSKDAVNRHEQQALMGIGLNGHIALLSDAT
jgi:6-phosphogluconolactonase/glucosamine-6-phosphate isomerase/deaminase